MRIEPHDFRKPSRLASELEEQLVGWLTGSFTVAGEKWAKHLAAPVAHALGGMETVRPVDAMAELTDPIEAYRVDMGTDLPTLMIISRPLVLTLVAGVLGDTCTELCADRSLTTVEQSLIEFLLQQFVAALQESWPGGQQLSVTLNGVEPAPKRTRIFKPEDNLVRFSLLMRGPFGEQTWHWLAPQQALTNLLSQSSAGPTNTQETGVRAQLESLVGEMPLDVAVQLGGAVLHVSQLAGLRSGDLVLLDQPVTRPLTASVAGETRFLVWPGRVGEKQAIQIASMVEC